MLSRIISHGCVLEAVVLAFENKFETYSSGKGNITIDKMEEIYGLSLKHGINIAPFYNSNGFVVNNDFNRADWKRIKIRLHYSN